MGNGKPVPVYFKIRRFTGMKSDSLIMGVHRRGQHTMLEATGASGPWQGQHTGPRMETVPPSRQWRDLANNVVLAATSIASGLDDETGTEIVIQNRFMECMQ
jgi:hypothetical protein